MVGRNPFREQAQPGIAVALGHVAEHLVVGAVLLDDVDAVLDGTGIAHLGRDGIARGRLRGRKQVFPQGAGLPGLLRVLGQLLRPGHPHFLQRALEQLADVFPHRLGGFAFRLGAQRVGPRTQPLAVGHVDRLPPGVVAHAGGIPARGNQPQRNALARTAHVEHGHRVVVRVGHKEHLPLGRQGDAIGRGARGHGGARVQRRADYFQRAPLLRVDDVDRVAVGTGHKQHLPVGRKQHLGRVQVGLPGGKLLAALGVQHGHRPGSPQTDKEPLAFPIRKHQVGIAFPGQGPFLQLVGILQRDAAYRVAPGVGRVEHRAVGREGKPGGNEPVLLGPRGRNVFPPDEVAVLELEAVDELLRAAAGIDVTPLGIDR